jgi:hypothetical protein
MNTTQTTWFTKYVNLFFLPLGETSASTEIEQGQEDHNGA